MRRIAERLSEAFDFIRVDLYSLRDRIGHSLLSRTSPAPSTRRPAPGTP
jgi:hypothetical protein